MTINHIFVNVTKSKMPAMRAFYLKALKPVGYTELIPVSDSLVGYGSDYPYLWLRALPDNVQSIPIHIALDAPARKSVDDFHSIGTENGGTSKGLPGIRPEMSVQPYYAAFVIDPDGNNMEVICLKK